MTDRRKDKGEGRKMKMQGEMTNRRKVEEGMKMQERGDDRK